MVVWLAAAGSGLALDPALLKQAGEAMAKGDFRAASQHYMAAVEDSASPALGRLGAGRAAFARADYQEAARQFEFASLAPGATPREVALALAGKAAAWLEPARETMEENAVTLAAEALDTAISTDPECAVALVWRGYLRTLRAKNHEDENNALGDLKAAHEQGEDGWLLYLARGCVAIGHGDIAERDKAFAVARQRLDAELKSRPEHLHAWLKSVEWCERTGDLDRLIDDHTGILKRWPERVASIAGRAYARVLKKDFPEAIADCTAALDKGDRRALVHWWRGYARTWTDDKEGALDDLGEAIVLNPELKGPLARRAWLQNARGEYDLAVDDANRALERWPDDLEAMGERGYACKELGRTGEAIRDFDQVLKVNPKSASILRYRAEARNLQGEFRLALEDASAAIELVPGDGYAWRARSVAHIGLKAYDKAIADATRTIELLPKHAPGYINRGAAHRARKQLAAALTDYDHAVALDPENPPWYRDRAGIHEQMGRRDSARQDLETARELDGAKHLETLPEPAVQPR